MQDSGEQGVRNPAALTVADSSLVIDQDSMPALCLPLHARNEAQDGQGFGLVKLTDLPRLDRNLGSFLGSLIV